MGRSDHRHGHKKYGRIFFVKEPMRVLQSTKRALRILDANYVATSTDELCEKQTHLQPIEMDKLKKLLKNYHTLLTGNLVL